MKNFMSLFLFFLLLKFVPTYSQNKELRILDSFILNDLKTKKDFVYTYELKLTGSSHYSFNIFEKNLKNSVFVPISIFDNFSEEVFTAIFEKHLNAVIPDSISISDPIIIKKKATEIFYKLKSEIEQNEDEPLTSYLILKKEWIYSFLSTNDDVAYDGYYANIAIYHYINNVEIEIEQGAIKNITVRLADFNAGNTRNYLVFKNRYPFSISSKFDTDNISNARMYCQNCSGVDKLNRYIVFGDFMFIDNQHENYKEDYSPRDTHIYISPQDPVRKLRKEKISQIIELAAYTDFIGVKKDQPNGLIQIEASRKINLVTKYHRFRKNFDFVNSFDFGEAQPETQFVRRIKRNWAIYKITFDSLAAKSGNFHSPEIKNKFEKAIRGNHRIIDSSEVYFKRGIVPEDDQKYTGYYAIKLRKFGENYFNFLGSIEPKFRFAKIEENLRNMIYSNSDVVNDTIKIDPLKFYQYQKLSFGAHLALIKVNFTQLKLSWHLNTGLYWFQTNISKDTASTNQAFTNVNAANYNFSSEIQFHPDGRWGCSMGAEYLKNKAFNKQMYFNSNSELLVYKFDGFLSTNATDKLFFRFRFINQIGHSVNSFSQIQLGYSMNLSKVDKKP